MLFIGLGYAVLAISYLIIETRHTLRQKSFGMLSCARYMYAFIYGILPATICLQGESGRCLLYTSLHRTGIGFAGT